MEKMVNKKVLVVSTTNDEFFMQNNIRAYWDLLRIYTSDNCHIRYEGFCKVFLVLKLITLNYYLFLKRRIPNMNHVFLANDTSAFAPQFYTFFSNFINSISKVILWLFRFIGHFIKLLINYILWNYSKPQQFVFPKISWNFNNQLKTSSINVFLQNVICPNVRMTVWAANTTNNQRFISLLQSFY